MKVLSRWIAVAVLMMSAVAVFAQNTGGYRIMNGKVYYNNLILHDADPHTLQDLGYGYAKDHENVWLEGRLLPLVDAKSFRLKTQASHMPSAGDGFNLGDFLAGIFGQGSGQNHGHGHPGQHDPGHPGHPGQPGQPGQPGYNPGQTGPGYPDYNPMPPHERGYEIIGSKVYFNGTVVSNASAHSFKDLGWGYAKDNYRVYYNGKKLTNNPSRFKALSDGYAMDSFDVYYFGKEIEASTSGFKVLSDGYAKDAFDAYYCGKEVVGSSASTFQVLGNGYAKDAWETYYLGKKVR